MTLFFFNYLFNFFQARGKSLDATQEMLTLGLCNLVGSFFQSIPVTGSFSRSAVSNASGVRTPFGGLYTGIFIDCLIKILIFNFRINWTYSFTSSCINLVLYLFIYLFIYKFTNLLIYYLILININIFTYSFIYLYCYKFKLWFN